MERTCWIHPAGHPSGARLLHWSGNLFLFHDPACRFHPFFRNLCHSTCVIIYFFGLQITQTLKSRIFDLSNHKTNFTLMKRIRMLALGLLIASSRVFAQQAADTTANQPGIPVPIGSDIPSYPGGQVEMDRFINEHLKLPADVNDSITWGTCLVFLSVGIDGSIEKSFVIKGINKTINQEILKVFSLMPKWIPASHNGVSVPYDIVVQITFNLIEKEWE
jgi:hypothetical protein